MTWTISSNARRRAVSACLGLASAFGAFGCDDEGDCRKGQSECISDSLLRTCVPDEEGARWFVSECADHARCEAAAGDEGGGAVCAGTCTTGQSECVGEQVARYCVDGRVWQLDPCDAGQRCVDGTCRYADGGLELCTPGSRQCGSEDIEKVCDRDGSKWLERECEAGEQCLVDRCAPDPDASCDVGSRCLDNKHAARCLGGADGFEVVECPGDTYCDDGRCRGEICALGAVCGAQNQVVECLDGTSLRNTQCGVNELCVVERDQASCKPRPCTPGLLRCGDPRDPTVDATRFYTQCLPPGQTESGLPEWVTGECTGLLTCDPAFAMAGQPCRQECTPGAQTCMADPLSGISDGWAECQDDGTWGPVSRCDGGGGLRQQCVIKPTLDASVLPEHLCAEPVCAYVIENQDGLGGACSGGELLACDEDGKVSDPAPCDIGICRATSLEVQADGRNPGACDIDVECEAGEERCLLDDIFPTPVYQTCDNGVWSSKLTSCASDEICLDYLDGVGLRKKVCGADCVPGEKRCNISDQVETCGTNGAWGNPQTCAAGVCQTLGATPGGKRDAACILECIPGSAVCTGAMITSSDGVTTGYSQESVCDAEGTLGAPVACAAGETCRVSAAGEHLGCVECVGPDVVGGNQFGYMDTRCDPLTPANVQECGANNAWSASRVCTGVKTCRMVNGGTCGNCLSGAGINGVCTETNVSDREICGPCTPTGGLQVAQCRQSLLTLQDVNNTCLNLFGDDPANGDTTGLVTWGGFVDCCDGSTLGGQLGEFLQNTSCTSLLRGAPSAWGGYPDCCGNYHLAGVGPAFAYCSDALP